MAAGKGQKTWYRYLFRENIYGMAIQGVMLVAGILFTVLLPRLLGADSFGYLSLVIGIVTLASMIDDFGLQFAAMRFLPEGVKKGIAGKYFRAMLLWKVALSITAAVLLFLGAGVVASAYNSPTLADGIRFGALFLLFYSLYTFMDNAFVGLKKARNSLLMNLAFQTGRVALPVALFFSYRQDYIGALIGMTAACGLAVLPAIFSALRDPALKKGTDGEMDLPALKSYSFYAFLNSIAYTTVQWADTLIIGLFRPISEVSVYRVAWLWATATAFLSPFSPRIFASAHAYEDKENSKKMFDLSLRYSFVFVFLMITGIILVAEQFLALIYGAESVLGGAYPVMVILSLLALEVALSNLSGSLLWGKGEVKATTQLTTATAACQILALLVMIPAYGIMGAAVGSVLVRVGAVLLQTRMALKVVGIRIPPKYVYAPVFCGVATIALLMPFKAYTFNWVMAVAYGTATVAVYCVLAVAVRAVDVSWLIGKIRGALGR